MLFGFMKKKKEEPKVPEKKELLYLENVRVNCKASTKEEVIRGVGQMLVDSGYVNPSYVDAMLKREETCSTYMGNGLAIPHGVEEAKKEVLASGISVMVFPEGVEWDGNNVHVAIGIAGVGDDHLSILAIIADKMLDDEVVATIPQADAETVYKLLGGN